MKQAAIVPAILSPDIKSYNQLMNELIHFADHLHIDLMDGTLTETKSLAIAQIYIPEGIKADIHLMSKTPYYYLDVLIALKPRCIIIHAEADGDKQKMLRYIKKFKIKAGLAILPQTNVDDIAPLITEADEVLIFGGNLGHYGGEANLLQLAKVKKIRNINPLSKLMWDGGVNSKNVVEIRDKGINNIICGSYIAKAKNSGKAYFKLVKRVDE